MRLKEVVCSSEKPHYYLRSFLKEMQKQGLAKQTFIIYLQRIIIEKNNKALIVKWLDSFSLISETLMLYQVFTMFPDISDPQLFVASSSHLPSREMWFREMWVVLREGHLTWLSPANLAISLNDLYLPKWLSQLVFQNII